MKLQTFNSTQLNSSLLIEVLR